MFIVYKIIYFGEEFYLCVKAGVAMLHLKIIMSVSLKCVVVHLLTVRHIKTIALVA